MPKRISKRAWATVPPVQEVELFWIDEKAASTARRKVRVGVARSKIVLGVPRGTVFNPGVARMESRDVDALIEWVTARLREGWINEVDLKERQDLMRRLIRKARGEMYAAPDPDKTAGIKKSGRGEKGSRKPIRDYRAPASVKNNGTIVGHRIKGVWGS